MKEIQKALKKIKYRDKPIFYGDNIAKLNNVYGKKNADVVLVSSINPNKVGIGKTTISISIADSLCLLKHKAMLALREPSLGPVFGLKGGATGGGECVVEPQDKINFHFTGDFHAITSANNLLCAAIDNHIYQGNALQIKTVLFNRCLDMNDRALRDVQIAVSKTKTRKESFAITPASEIMSILCLCTSYEDLKEKIGNILIGKTAKGNPVFAKELNIQNAMAKTLEDAIMPNFVLTKHKTPTLIHGGPFANISTGCNSVIATKLASSYADIVITEAGFGFDLGGEKFLGVKCKNNNINVKAVILVATVEALKLHGGAEDVKQENVAAAVLGCNNIFLHANTISKIYSLPVGVVLNKKQTDSKKEIDAVVEMLKQNNIDCAINTAFVDGVKGGIESANLVLSLLKQNAKPTYLQQEQTVKQKIEEICKKVYGAKKVVYDECCKEKFKLLKQLNKNNADVVIAKTPFSLTDNAKGGVQTKDFEICITDIEIKTGADFVVAKCGDIMLMPGLNKKPNYLKM